MRRTLAVTSLMMIAAAAVPCRAAPQPAAIAVARGSDTVSPQPVVSADGSWVGVLVIVSAGLFLASAIIGPVVHREFPDEVPPAHAHDEPPGSSHRHGPGGTFAPEPR